MASNATWQGFLRISLVTIPVRAFNATISSEGSIALNQLHAECHRRIEYKKFCPVHGEVSKEEIVSGYQYAKGKYVIVEPEDLAKLRAQKDHSLDVAKFAPLDQVSPLALDGRDYYLVPDSTLAHKPYQLIQQAMAAANVCGIGQMVLSRREELVMVRPMEHLLVLSTLKYAHELQPPDDFQSDLSAVKATKQEQQLTDQLISALTDKQFDLAEFHDTDRERMEELIAAKTAGKEIVVPAQAKEPKVINFADAVRKSMQQLQPRASESKSRTSSKKKPARTPTVRSHARRKSG